MTCSSKVLRYLLAIAVVASVCSLTAFFLIFQAAFTENKNHLQVLWAIAQMEASRSAVAIADHPQQLVVGKSGIDSYLKARGWTFVDQTGSLSTYGKADSTESRLLVNCGAYTAHYLICDLSADPDRE